MNVKSHNNKHSLSMKDEDSTADSSCGEDKYTLFASPNISVLLLGMGDNFKGRIDRDLKVKMRDKSSAMLELYNLDNSSGGSLCYILDLIANVDKESEQVDSSGNLTSTVYHYCRSNPTFKSNQSMRFEVIPTAAEGMRDVQGFDFILGQYTMMEDAEVRQRGNSVGPRNGSVDESEEPLQHTPNLVAAGFENTGVAARMALRTGGVYTGHAIRYLGRQYTSAMAPAAWKSKPSTNSDTDKIDERGGPNWVAEEPQDEEGGRKSGSKIVDCNNGSSIRSSHRQITQEDIERAQKRKEWAEGVHSTAASITSAVLYPVRWTGRMAVQGLAKGGSDRPAGAGSSSGSSSANTRNYGSHNSTRNQSGHRNSTRSDGSSSGDAGGGGGGVGVGDTMGRVVMDTLGGLGNGMMSVAKGVTEAMGEVGAAIGDSAMHHSIEVNGADYAASVTQHYVEAASELGLAGYKVANVAVLGWQGVVVNAALEGTTFMLALQDYLMGPVLMQGYMDMRQQPMFQTEYLFVVLRPWSISFYKEAKDITQKPYKLVPTSMLDTLPKLRRRTLALPTSVGGSNANPASSHVSQDTCTGINSCVNAEGTACPTPAPCALVPAETIHAVDKTMEEKEESNSNSTLLEEALSPVTCESSSSCNNISSTSLSPLLLVEERQVRNNEDRRIAEDASAINPSADNDYDNDYKNKNNRIHNSDGDQYTAKSKRLVADPPATGGSSAHAAYWCRSEYEAFSSSSSSSSSSTAAAAAAAAGTGEKGTATGTCRSSLAGHSADEKGAQEEAAMVGGLGLVGDEGDIDEDDSPLNAGCPVDTNAVLVDAVNAPTPAAPAPVPVPTPDASSIEFCTIDCSSFVIFPPDDIIHDWFEELAEATQRVETIAKRRSGAEELAVTRRSRMFPTQYRLTVRLKRFVRTVPKTSVFDYFQNVGGGSNSTRQGGGRGATTVGGGVFSPSKGDASEEVPTNALEATAMLSEAALQAQRQTHVGGDPLHDCLSALPPAPTSASLASVAGGSTGTSRSNDRSMRVGKHASTGSSSSSAGTSMDTTTAITTTTAAVSKDGPDRPSLSAFSKSNSEGGEAAELLYQKMISHSTTSSEADAEGARGLITGEGAFIDVDTASDTSSVDHRDGDGDNIHRSTTTTTTTTTVGYVQVCEQQNDMDSMRQQNRKEVLLSAGDGVGNDRDEEDLVDSGFYYVRHQNASEYHAAAHTQNNLTENSNDNQNTIAGQTTKPPSNSVLSSESNHRPSPLTNPSAKSTKCIPSSSSSASASASASSLGAPYVLQKSLFVAELRCSVIPITVTGGSMSTEKYRFPRTPLMTVGQYTHEVEAMIYVLRDEEQRLLQAMREKETEKEKEREEENEEENAALMVPVSESRNHNDENNRNKGDTSLEWGRTTNEEEGREMKTKQEQEVGLLLRRLNQVRGRLSLLSANYRLYARVNREKYISDWDIFDPETYGVESYTTNHQNNTNYTNDISHGPILTVSASALAEDQKTAAMYGVDPPIGKAKAAYADHTETTAEIKQPTKNKITTTRTTTTTTTAGSATTTINSISNPTTTTTTTAGTTTITRTFPSTVASASTPAAVEAADSVRRPVDTNNIPIEMGQNVNILAPTDDIRKIEIKVNRRRTQVTNFVEWGYGEVYLKEVFGNNAAVNSGSGNGSSSKNHNNANSTKPTGNASTSSSKRQFTVPHPTAAATPTAAPSMKSVGAIRVEDEAEATSNPTATASTSSHLLVENNIKSDDDDDDDDNGVVDDSAGMIVVETWIPIYRRSNRAKIGEMLVQVAKVPVVN